MTLNLRFTRSLSRKRGNETAADIYYTSDSALERADTLRLTAVDAKETIANFHSPAALRGSVFDKRSDDKVFARNLKVRPSVQRTRLMREGLGNTCQHRACFAVSRQKKQARSAWKCQHSAKHSTYMPTWGGFFSLPCTYFWNCLSTKGCIGGGADRGVRELEEARAAVLSRGFSARGPVWPCIGNDCSHTSSRLHTESKKGGESRAGENEREAHLFELLRVGAKRKMGRGGGAAGRNASGDRCLA